MTLADNDQDLNVRKKIISLLDFTHLDDQVTPEIINDLCRKAVTPLGTVAAVCIPANFVAQAKAILTGTNITIATVVNFPFATGSLAEIETEINFALNAGADEIDVVLPFQLYLTAQRPLAQRWLAKVRALCKVKLKIILETGALITADLISQAAVDAINAGTDFIKTSTGKIPQGATLEAAETMLTVIKNNSFDNKKLIGFKASGGIRTVAQANNYLALAEKIFGRGWLAPATFRFGASSLLNAALKLNSADNSSQIY